MVFHPRENRRPIRRTYTRREFLQRSAAVGILLPGVYSAGLPWVAVAIVQGHPSHPLNRNHSKRFPYHRKALLC